MTRPGNATRRMLQRSIIRPRTGTVSAEQIPPNDKANDAAPRCHPMSAMIGFRKTPKVNPSTGPLHTTRPPTAPTTTHHGLVKLSRMLSSLVVECNRIAISCGSLTHSPGYRPLPRFAAGLSCPAARRLFSQHRNQTLHLSAVMLDYGSKLGALGDRHADAVHRYVADLVDAVSSGQAPIHFDRRGAAGADDLAGHDRTIRIGPAAGHLELFAGVFRQARCVSHCDVILEQLHVLRPLLLGRGIPVPAEDKTGDPRNVEILAQQFAKPRHPLRLSGILPEHLEGSAAEIADQGGRVGRCRRGDGG